MKDRIDVELEVKLREAFHKERLKELILRILPQPPAAPKTKTKDK